jgi:site-specific recombinase XerD
MKTTRRQPRARPRTDRPASWEEARERFIRSLADEERSRHTRDHYEADIRAFEAWWDENRPDERLLPTAVVEEDIRDWKRSLKTESLDDTGRTRKPATINAKLAAVKSFLRWCQREEIIPAMPAMPRREKLGAPAVKWLDQAEERRLLRALEQSKRHREGRNLPMVQVMLGTGLRVAELVALEWRDITISERKGDVIVRAGKGCKPRTVPIARTARAAFRRLQELDHGHKPTDPVFSSQRRDRLTPRGVQQVLAPFNVHPHQLRHTYGMRLQRAGRPLPEIAKLMGHSSVVTTMQSYGTPSEVDLRGAVESIDPGGDDDD